MPTSMLLQNGTVLAHQPDDTIKALRNTDILIEDDKITAISPKITPPSKAQIIDCTNKILSPGFIDTHRHLWQTQLKGRHADHSLLEYIAPGNMQSYNYTPTDIFYGQLSGALESIDAGTTTILDHAHGCYEAAHADNAMAAMLASGVRSVLAIGPVTRVQKWDMESCVPDPSPMPDWIMEHVERWAHEGGAHGLYGRVQVGLQFDWFFLPKELVQQVWSRVKESGAQLVTSHVMRNALFGTNSTVQLLDSYGLLKNPSEGGVRWVISHGNGLPKEDLDLLAKNDVYISTTTETEAQMGHGNAMAFEPGVKACLGVDCHTNNTANMLQIARTLLQVKRQETNDHLLQRGEFPRSVKGTTLEAFNMLTINGARALGLQDSVGSLAVGKKADIVVFDYENSVSMLCAGDYDPLVSVFRHSDVRDVETVIVNGVVRKSGGKLCDVEIEGEKTPWREVAKRTRASQVALQKRIDGVNLQKGEELLMGMLRVDMEKIVPVV